MDSDDDNDVNDDNDDDENNLETTPLLPIETLEINQYLTDDMYRFTHIRLERDFEKSMFIKRVHSKFHVNTNKLSRH